REGPRDFHRLPRFESGRSAYIGLGSGRAIPCYRNAPKFPESPGDPTMPSLHRALCILLALTLAGPPVPAVAIVAPDPVAEQAKATDLDKIIPGDCLLHVQVAGIDPLQSAVTELMEAVMPGGGAMAGMMFSQMLMQPAMGEIDRAKPIVISLMPSE